MHCSTFSDERPSTTYKQITDDVLRMSNISAFQQHNEHIAEQATHNDNSGEFKQSEFNIELSISNRWLMTFKWKCSLNESKNAITCLGNGHCFCFVWRFTNRMMTQNVQVIVSFTKGVGILRRNELVFAMHTNGIRNKMKNLMKFYTLAKTWFIFIPFHLVWEFTNRTIYCVPSISNMPFHGNNEIRPISGHFYHFNCDWNCCLSNNSHTNRCNTCHYGQ